MAESRRVATCSAAVTGSPVSAERAHVEGLRDKRRLAEVEDGWRSVRVGLPNREAVIGADQGVALCASDAASRSPR